MSMHSWVTRPRYGSALLTELIAERKRIRAEMQARHRFKALPPPPTVLPPLPPQNIKSVEERISEAWRTRNGLPPSEFGRIVWSIRQSELDSKQVREVEPRYPKIIDIQKLVASHFNLSRDEMLSARGTVSVLRQRQVAMYLCRLLTPRSFSEIGRLFGGRDHTIVIYAVRKISDIVNGTHTCKRTVTIGEAEKKLAVEISVLKEIFLS